MIMKILLALILGMLAFAQIGLAQSNFNDSIEFVLKGYKASEVLAMYYPDKKWPIEGGWGHSMDDAVIINMDNSREGVKFEYEYMEAISSIIYAVLKPETEAMEVMSVRLKKQLLILGQDAHEGHSYDKMEVEISGLIPSDLEMLRKDFADHNEYEGDEEGKKKFDELYLSKLKKVPAEFWFDITRIFGKY